MKKKSYYQRFMEMSDEQRDAEVAKYDREFVGTPGKPLTPSEKALHRRARSKAGRPRVGRGAKRLTITMERELLNEADLLARKKQISRSQLFAWGIRALLKAG